MRACYRYCWSQRLLQHQRKSSCPLFEDHLHVAVWVVPQERKANKKVYLGKVVDAAVKTYLVQPFFEAAARGQKDMCMLLAMAWATYSNALVQQHRQEPESLVELAVQAVTMLEQSQKMMADVKDKGGSEPDLGAFLHSGEMPHAQVRGMRVCEQGSEEIICFSVCLMRLFPA